MSKRINRVEAGQSMVEYALLLGLISIIVLGMLMLMSSSLSDAFGTVATELADTTAQSTAEPTPTPTLPPESGPWEEWYPAKGRGWTIEDEQYCVRTGGEHRSFYGAENWTDYLVKVNATLYKGNGFGIYFRATDVDHLNGYIFQYDPKWRCSGSRGCFIYRKIEGGRERYPFAAASPPSDYQWHDVTREIAIRVEGDTFVALVDGEEVLRATDSQYANGQVGLRTSGGSEVCFADLQIILLESPERDRDDRDSERGRDDRDPKRDRDDRDSKRDRDDR